MASIHNVSILLIFTTRKMNLDALATSDLKGVAGNVGGKGTAEQEDRASGLLNLTSTLQGGVGKDNSGWGSLLLGAHGDSERNLLAINNHGLAVLLGTGQTGIDIAKGNGVAADAERAPLLGDGLGQTNDTGLGSGVVGLTNVTVESRGGGDLNIIWQEEHRAC